MREIKFKIWESEGKGMSEPITIQELILEECPLNPKDIVLQYTGLKDKNGKEIYEGDIVNVIDRYGWIRKQISWCGNISAFGHKDEDREWVIVGSQWGIEVIGNIYENPELLK
jgi:uncharacterized phage protein (TIGR01671 family)